MSDKVNGLTDTARATKILADKGELAKAQQDVNLSKQYDGPMDEYNLTAAEREEYGIGPDEVIHWARHPDEWRRLGTGVADDVTERMRAWPGARVIRDKHGRHVTCGGDLCLMVYPSEHKKQVQDHIDTNADAFIAFDPEMAAKFGMNAEQRSSVLRESGPYPGSEFGLTQQSLDDGIRRATMAQRKASSPTAGMSYETAVDFHISRMISEAEQNGVKLSRDEAAERVIQRRERFEERLLAQSSFNPNNTDYEDMMRDFSGSTFSVGFGEDTSIETLRQRKKVK